MRKTMLVMTTLVLVLGFGHIASGAPTLLIDENWDDGAWDGGSTPLTWLSGSQFTLSTPGGKGSIATGRRTYQSSVGIQNVQFNLSTDLPIRITLNDVDTSSNTAEDSRFRLTITDQPVNSTTMNTYPDGVSGCHLVYAPNAWTDPAIGSPVIELQTFVYGGAFNNVTYGSWVDNYDIDMQINSFTGPNNVVVSAPAAIAGTYTIDFAGLGFNANADYSIVFFTYNRNTSGASVSFDNLQVWTNVPEPASLFLLLIGSLFAVRRRVA